MPLHRLARRGTATLATVLLAVVGAASNAAATTDVETVTGTITPVAIDHHHGHNDDAAVAVITTDDGAVVPVEVPPALEGVAPGTEIVARVVNTPGDEPAEIVAHNIGASPRAAPVAAIHRYYTVIISDPGNSSSHETAGVNVANTQAGQYWSRESRGVVTSFDASTANRKTVTRSNSCSLSYNEVWELGKAEFPGVSFTGTSGNHLVVWSPSNCSYPYAGLATVGGGLNYGGMVHMVSGEVSVLVHELGHNFGLGHSNAALSNGTIHEYYGLYSPQAISVTGVGSGMLDAAYQEQLQVPGTAAQRREVVAGSVVDVDLLPVGSASGTTALSFMGSNGKKHYVEYRDCLGNDRYALCGMHPGAPLNYGISVKPGVVMYYVDGNDLVYLPIGTYSSNGMHYIEQPYTEQAATDNSWSLRVGWIGGGSAEVQLALAHTPSTPTPVATTTSVQVPPTVVEGTAVTANVTVSASSPVIGDVTVSIDGTALGLHFLTNGTAAVSIPTHLLTPGSHTVTARYEGISGQFEPSTGTATLTVSAGLQATTTTVSVPSTVEGRVPTATVRVVSNVSTQAVTGSITVSVGGTTVATNVPLSNGRASVALPSDLGVGTHTVTARYNGVPNVFSRSNGTGTFEVTAAPPAGTGPTLTVTAPGVKYGVPATVTVASPGVTSGTIDLYVNGKLYGSASLTAGLATFRLDAELDPGAHQIEARYRGFGAVIPGPGSAILRVAAPPTPTVMVDAPDTTYGTAGWVTVHVTAPGVTPQGTVELLLNGKTQTHLTLASGVTRHQFSALLTADTYVVEARYAGNKQVGPAQGQDIMIVAGPAVSTTSVQDHTISYGQTLNLPIEVTASAAVSGSVQVYQGTKLLGTTTVTGGKGVYKLPTDSWGVGTHKVTVKYLGTTRVTASSATSTVTVGKGDATITARATGLRVGGKATVTVTAVGAGLQAPNGKVTVLVNGTPVSSAVNLSSSSGKWTATVTTNVITTSGPVTISYTPANTILKSGVFTTNLAV